MNVKTNLANGQGNDRINQAYLILEYVGDDPPIQHLEVLQAQDDLKDKRKSHTSNSRRRERQQAL